MIDKPKAMAVCDRLEAEPHLGLREILRQAELPERTFRDWRNADTELGERYKEAKLNGFDNLAQQCLTIADDGTADFIATDKGEAFNAEHVQRSKLRIDTRVKLLAKWYPAKYGDKLDLNHSGTANFSLTVNRKHKPAD